MVSTLLLYLKYVYVVTVIRIFITFSFFHFMGTEKQSSGAGPSFEYVLLCKMMWRHTMQRYSTLLLIHV